MHNRFIGIMNKICIAVIAVLLIGSAAQAQTPGARAAKLRGTWWLSGMLPVLDSRFLELKTVDGFGVGFSSGATYSAEHFAPCPFLRSLDGGEYLVPDNDDTTYIDKVNLIRNAGYKIAAYNNCEGFVGTNADELEEGAQAFKDWCDTDPDAIAFVNSESYYTDDDYPNRKYMFCYAEYVIKYYSEQYGEYIDCWIFDDAGTMQENGDDYSTGDVDDQRIYEAFANAARAGNDDIAVSFNNGQATLGYDAWPFQIPTRFDDYSFGHAYGGNSDHASLETGTFDRNYGYVERMTETDGYVHDGGDWTWDDAIVGNFHSKLSTGAWNFGAEQAWEQDDFNEWNAEALSAGGMMTWDGSYNRTETAVYDWVYTMIKSCDDYLYANGISLNDFMPDPNKTYYIDCPKHDLRLAATGSSADAYTTSTSTTGSDVEWKFVDKGNGYWHIDRAAGGSLPRLRTDNTANADMQATSSAGSYTYWGFSEGTSSGTHFFTLPDGPSSYCRLQIDNSGNVKMVSEASAGTWESFTFTEVSEDSIVQIRKRNALDYCLNGGSGGADGQNVSLWTYISDHVNLSWEEIDRGDGYYSYQKEGTNYSLDGGNGGANQQTVYLWTTDDSNYNQQWKKVDMGDGYVQLQKRNATGYAINGGSDGANSQDVNLYDSSSASYNLQWLIEYK
jgi:hypothetical protein